MIIRIAEQKDLPEILELYKEVEDGDAETMDLAAATEIFGKMKTYPDYKVYVAVNDDGAVVGTFALAIMDNIAHYGSKSGLIEDVIVSAACQRQGVGKRMMRFATEVCREKGCYKVSLSSNIKRVNAHKFYQDIGYKIHGYSFLTELE